MRLFQLADIGEAKRINILHTLYSVHACKELFRRSFNRQFGTLTVILKLGGINLRDGFSKQ